MTKTTITPTNTVKGGDPMARKAWRWRRGAAAGPERYQQPVLVIAENRASGETLEYSTTTPGEFADLSREAPRFYRDAVGAWMDAGEAEDPGDIELIGTVYELGRTLALLPSYANGADCV